MKKWLGWMTAALLLFGSASAQTISPTTGLPIDGEPVAPMLVVISNTEANVAYNGHTAKAQGVGKRQAWGGRLLPPFLLTFPPQSPSQAASVRAGYHPPRSRVPAQRHCPLC